MKSTLIFSFLTGSIGAMVSVAAFVELTNSGPQGPAVDLTPVVTELRTLVKQQEETQAVVKAALAADDLARQAERDEVADAIRRRNKMMGITP